MSPMGQKQALTMPTIQSNAFSALNSTPPSSSSCSSVSSSKEELWPTTASKDTYGTGRALPVFPRIDVIVVVRGIVRVRVSWRCTPGKKRRVSLDIISRGPGKPPKFAFVPRCAVLRNVRIVSDRYKGVVVLLPVYSAIWVRNHRKVLFSTYGCHILCQRHS
jgi:hypothetical protein